MYNEDLDPLTGAYTYDSFLQKAEELFAQHPLNARFGVLYGDFLNFKYLNQIYGHDEGDRVLRSFFLFLEEHEQTLLRARLFSDFFLVLCQLTEEADMAVRAEQFESAFQSFVLQDRERHSKCHLEIVCGACEVQRDRDGVKQAVDNANAARKRIKTTTHHTVCVTFDRERERRRRDKSLLSGQIQDALRDEAFCVFLQPKISLQTGRIVGAEALARWVKPNGTIVSPGTFIPVMEEDGSIVELDFFVYRKVLALMREREEQGLPNVPVSMNVSRCHLNNPHFAKSVCKLVSQYGIHPSLVEFELTETLFHDAVDEARALIHALHREGFLLSIDDFGSGYSSLNLLREVRFDVLKLDRSFIADMEDGDQRGRILLESILDMAHRLSMSVVCEGVETKEQLLLMQKLGCEMVQGFYFAKPLPVSEFTALLQRGSFELPLRDAAREEEPRWKELVGFTAADFSPIYHNIFTALSAGICGISLHNYGVIFTNELFFEFVGYPRTALAVKDNDEWLDILLSPQERKRVMQQMMADLENGQTAAVECTFRQPNGMTQSIVLRADYAVCPQWGRYILCMLFRAEETNSHRIAAQKTLGS